MNDELKIFEQYQVDFKKLINLGFNYENDIYQISKLIYQDEFKLNIKIDNNGNVSYQLIEISFDEEYPLIKLKRGGTFSSKLKEEIINCLVNIRDNCFIKKAFLFDQTSRIIQNTSKIYQTNIEYPWEDDTVDGIFRNQKTRKWFLLLMKINQNKLDHKTNQMIEIINLKLDKDKIVNLISKPGFYPAYHMNKKNWITIILNDTLKDDTIMEMIEESYQFSCR